jgi:hypothetical protein
MSSDNDLVWTSLLDGRYTVAVTRTTPYCGELTIAEGANVLFRKEVSLAYDARFGPDVADVVSWQCDVITFIDGRTN